jgi:glutaredoxin
MVNVDCMQLDSVLRRVFTFVGLLTLVMLMHCSGPTSPRVKGEGRGQQFTYQDNQGAYHLADSVTKIPQESRARVRVTDPQFPNRGDQVFVADLRGPEPSDGYACRPVPRHDFFGLAEPPSSGNLGPGPVGSAAVGAVRVIIYGASWCGPCHQAKAFLKKKNVPFRERDIEDDPSAQREMQEKLRKHGLRAGSIPVLDVEGKIMVGYDEGSLARALRL